MWILRYEWYTNKIDRCRFTDQVGNEKEDVIVGHLEVSLRSKGV